MRVGLGLSIVGHAALLGFGFFAFPDAEAFKPEAIEALPVDLVKVSEVTDVLEGDKDSEILPEEKPQPKEEVKAEAPAPDPVEKPTEKPVEAARQPQAAPPPPPEPELEPEPQPEPEEVAALPEPAEPEPLPEPEPEAEPAPPKPVEKPVESRVPKTRPKPPRKPVEQAKPQPPEPEEKDRLRELAKAEPEPDFNTEDIAALLNKQDAAGGGDPVPAEEPKTLGSITGKPTAAMTQSWIAALTSKLVRCWNPPVGAREAGALVVTVSFNLLPDGSLAAPPVPVEVMGVSNPQAVAAMDAAVRAVAQCAPYNDVFPPEHYEQWQSILIDFDPSKMLGAG